MAAVSAAASGPMDLVAAMDAHDKLVIAATDSGRAGDWADALASLDDSAQRALVPVRSVRDVAHDAGLDMSTLDDLLDRLDDLRRGAHRPVHQPADIGG